VAEVNNPPGGIRVMPLPGGWRPLPVGITFYRSKSNATWKPQLLSMAPLAANNRIDYCGLS
jgi:hypothetical protein